MILKASKIILVIFMVSGCTTQKPQENLIIKQTPVGKAYAGQTLPLNEIAIISSSDDRAIHFRGIDNRNFGAFPPFKKYPKAISITPGRHVVRLGYARNSMIASGSVVIDSQPGKKYQAGYTIDGRKITFSIKENIEDSHNYVQK